MQIIHTYNALVDTVEAFYTDNSNLEDRWPMHILKSVMAIANVASENEHRHVAMAARAYLTLNEFEREMFAESYEIPGSVSRAMITEISWPEPLTVQDYDGPSFVDVEAYRNYGLSMVDDLTYDARLNLVTPLPGQDMIYLRKEAEARRYVALDTEPADLSDFPMMSFETGVTAPTAMELANLWLVMAAAWEAAAAPIEGARQVAKIAIKTATTSDEITAALDAFRENLGLDA